MDTRMTAGPGHTERHTMKDTGRTILVRCLCGKGRDHPYGHGSRNAATAAPLSGSDRAEQC